MSTIKQLQLALIALTMAYTSVSIANNNQPFYLAISAGTFQASFDTRYLDRTDPIPQHISQPLQQYGYIKSIAIGYSRFFSPDYLVGVELSENSDSHHANFASGASTSAFTDTIEITNHVDLSFVPGVSLNDSTTAYLKLGLSLAALQDTLYSPAGYAPTMTRYTSSHIVSGFATGLGLKKYLNEKVSVFIEGTYHDYGVTHLSDFQNFTATYTHTAHIYSYGGAIGAAINF